ncbi:MAG: T9SS type A sorting domain-containing protein [Lentimicrobiaceae bacterium]|nr:T9SS type A sorting domain-containing protein [Lentimicrobiaceae bacterium]
MKYIATFCLLFTLIFPVKAQSTFEFLLPTDTRTYSIMAIDDNNGGIITLISTVTGVGGPWEYLKGYVLEISATGDTTSHQYSFHDTAFFLNSIHRLNNGGYIVTGRSAPPNTSAVGLLLIGLDDDFNLQWAKHYPYSTYNNDVWIHDIYQDGDTLIMPAGRCEFPCGSMYPMFLKTDLNGNILQEVFHDNPLLDSGQASFLQSIDRKTIFMFAFEFIGGVTGPSYTAFNNDFEYLYTLPLIPQDHSSWRYYNTWSPDSIMLMSYLSARTPENHHDKDVWLARYDTAFNLLNRVNFGSVDTLDYTPFGGAGIGSLHPDTIFFAGFKNAALTLPGPSKVSWLMAGQVDSQLQPRFLHYIGGDAYYEARYMLPLSDGGFLIHAGKLNRATQLYDAYFIKLNKEGLITGNKPEHTIINCAFISPNPAKENLKVECMLKGAEARVLSITGTELAVYGLEQGASLIPLQDLKPGMYLLGIAVPGKGLIETHKFIKL